jgi:putative sigma-54 modulation protein
VELKITGRHKALTDDVRDYAEEKLARVERYDNRMRLLEVVLEEDRKRVKLEAKAHLKRGAPLVVTAEHATPEGAVDRAHDLLERALGRRKEKFRDRSRRNNGVPAPNGAPLPRASGDHGEEE